MDPMETEKKVELQDANVNAESESTELSDTELDDVAGGEGGTGDSDRG